MNVCDVPAGCPFRFNRTLFQSQAQPGCCQSVDSSSIQNGNTLMLQIVREMHLLFDSVFRIIQQLQLSLYCFDLHFPIMLDLKNFPTPSNLKGTKK